MIKKFTILTFVIVISVCIRLSAQPGDPGGDPDNPVPIGGLEILIASGAALGVRSLLKRKEK